ncbi:MAG: NAD+ synthase [bacterium]|nr:NAD+ synthase [bacterium]MDT8367284.1 NAD+ synthase [bacterium]
MIVTLHQINTTVGDFDGNLEKILRGARQAEGKGASLAVFPELSLTGYPPLDLLENRTFILEASQALSRLILESKGLDLTILVGSIMPRDESNVGKSLNNAAILIRRGDILATHFKVLLPTYDVFDESRYFEPGATLTVAQVDGRPIAISVCEDVWNDKTYWTRPQYHFDPVEDVLTSNPNTPLINIAASPYSHGKGPMRYEMLANTARRFGATVLYVNQVGGNDSLVLDGRSLALDPAGSIIALADDFREQLLVIDLDDISRADSASDSKRPVSKYNPIKDTMGTMFKALSTGLADYAGKCGFRTCVLGLSGGIDSAVTAVIACETLGSANVHGILMPSPYTSVQSVNDAELLAANLGMKTTTIPITRIYEQYLKDLTEGLDGLPGNTTEENIQARIRGNILMALSNRFGHLVLSTGNKSELATGYCTLYGDMSGGLAVISDLYKGEVYEMARHINRTVEVIPESIITKAPSAELRHDQKDSDTLPSYDLLDTILKAYLEEKKTLPEIVEMGYSSELVKNILNMVESNEYKRQQAAPGIKVSWKAFGLGRRCPIAKADLF